MVLELVQYFSAYFSLYVTYTLFNTGALETLSDELVPNTPPAAATADYRKSLAISLFYKVATQEQTSGHNN